ncbi:hypothetical protein AKJ08_1529 [Vulgatibacter incomptus]|uniref:Uncharacterized protein n=1 Tax=Vulgatibacter incomptus TaxID=1391653 RepID=A0A0K1PCA5_9BACT|nr:hypothetical protein AKJ08_1529 [Vulgatibacter incomptus]
MVFLLLGAIACGEESGRRVVDGQGGSGGAGGSDAGGEGGEGGSAGGGGEGGAGGTAGTPGSSWDGYVFDRQWRHQGFAEVGALVVADFLGDGTTQVAVGGRRPLLFSGDGSGVIWFADWAATDNLLLGGDNDWVYDLAAVPAGDGRANLLVASSMGDATLFDGRDGQVIWRIPIEAKFPFFTVFDSAAGPTFFPHFGDAAFAAETGEELWRLPVQMVPTFVHRSSCSGSDGLLLVDEGDAWVGGPGQGRPGSVACLTGNGGAAFSFALGAGEQPIAAGRVDLDGSGIDDTVVATWGRPLRVWDGQGELRWQRDVKLFGNDPTRTLVTQILARDLDGDGKEEILVVARDAWAADIARSPTIVLALDANGTERWRLGTVGYVTHAEVAEWGGEPLLLLSTGYPDLGTPGGAIAVRLANDATDRVRFRFDTWAQIRTFAVGGDTLVLGGDDGMLRAIDDAGALRWENDLGSFFTASGAIPIGAEDWLATGDYQGSLALLDATGTRRWFRRLEVGRWGIVVEVAAAHVERDGAAKIVAAARAMRSDGEGVIERFSLDGIREATLPLIGEPVAMAVADLDGDGVDEVLVLEGRRAGQTSCTLRCYGQRFDQAWATAIAPCQYGEISVGEVDGAGKVAIVVRTEPGLIDYPNTLSVVNPDGVRRWLVPEETELSLWARAVPGGLVFGGATTERNGFVARRDGLTGAMQWKSLLPPKPNPVDPDGESLPGASWFGHVFQEEGVLRIAATTCNNEAVLLDGATGDIAWSVDTEVEPHWHLHRRNGGPIVFVPGSDSVPPHLVTAQSADSRRRADAVVLLMDGTLGERVPMPGEAWRAVPLRRSDGSTAVAVQVLLGVHAVGVRPVE